MVGAGKSPGETVGVHPVAPILYSYIIIHTYYTTLASFEISGNQTLIWHIQTVYFQES